MSEIDVESIQSYIIDRDDYIVGYSSDKNSKNPPLITTTGIIIYREESEFEDSNDSDNNGFQGFKYRYHIQSHHKKLTFFDKEAANGGIQATGEEQKKQEELNNLYHNEVTLTNSLIYIAYSNDRYSEFDRVFIKKEGSWISILGRPQGARTAVPKLSDFQGSDDCKITVALEKKVKKNSAKQISAKLGDATSDEPREEKKSVNYDIEINSECNDKISSFYEQSLTFSAHSTAEKDYIGMYPRNNTITIKGKPYINGKTYWNNSMRVFSIHPLGDDKKGIIIPSKHEKNIKRLCEDWAKYAKQNGVSGIEAQVWINSVFRPADVQQKLYDTAMGKHDEKIEKLKAKIDENSGLWNSALRGMNFGDGYNEDSAKKELTKLLEMRERNKIGVAPPGLSEHGRGAAIDFILFPTDPGKTWDMAFVNSCRKPDTCDSKFFKWLAKNYSEYGLNSHLKSPFEPWHWEFKDK